VLISGIVQVNQMKVVEKIQQRIFARYAFEFSFKIPRLKLAETDGYHMPELVNRFFDVVSLQKSLSKLLLEIPLAVIQVLFGIILLSFYNPLFIVLGLMLLLMLYLSLSLTAKRGLEASLRESNYKYDVVAWLEELARAFKSFKVSGKHNLHLKKTDQLLEGYLEARTDHFNVLKLQYWSLIIFKLLITAAMLFVGALLLIDQQLNLGQFIAAEIVIITVLAAVEKLILSLDKAYDVLTSLEKLSKVTDKQLESNGKLIFSENNNGVSLRAENLSFGFKKDKNILEKIDFSIAAGQKVCIQGNTGSGKSVLMELATGSSDAYQGSLLINDVPIGNYDLESFRHHIGVFYHEQDIFHGTLMENITMGDNSIDIAHLMKLADVVGLKKLIASMPKGFDEMLKPTGKGLSSIVAKKILLLRAFAGSPKLLLLDEPFEMAGGEDCDKIAAYLKTLKQTTVIVVTGNKTFAEQCDQVLVMENGKIKQQ
jgi:ABC-type bacteriocin/lantibiotic exporter with double-glycine peptidase domain